MDSDEKEKRKLEDREDRKMALRVMGKMSQLGLTAITCIVLCLLAGYWLDRWLNTAPVLFIIFAFIGCAAAIKTMMDIAKKF